MRQMEEQMEAGSPVERLDELRQAIPRASPRVRIDAAADKTRIEVAADPLDPVV